MATSTGGHRPGILRPRHTTLAEQFHVAVNGHWEPVGWWREGETTIHAICAEQDDECVQLFRFVEPED